jgi:hypothetical protein
VGRHSTTARGAKRSPILVVSIVLVLALVGWFTFDFIRDKLKVISCDTTTELNVTAAPDIAPVITQIGNQVSKDAGTSCYTVSVASRDSAATAEALGVSDGSERPDVWLPESSMWLRRAQDKGAWNTPVAGAPVATSPVVMAMSEGAASELGWPAKTLTWGQVIGPAAAPTLAVGFPDPARDAVGVATLFGLRDLIKNAPDPGAAGTATMRKLSPNTVSQASDLYAKLPGGSDATTPIAAFPASENALLRYNSQQAAAKLVAVYAEPAVPSLDYPYVVLPDTADAKRTAAQKFLDRLTGEESRGELADAGFRTPDGDMVRDRAQDKRTSAAPKAPTRFPDADAVDQALNSWAAVNLSGRVQVLIDVSGSMNEPVPGTGKNRMTLTMEAAVAGVGLFKQTTKISWWLFSTKLDGQKDYEILLPMRTVKEQLAAGALDRLAGVRAVQGGGTGLYDTVLAAYQDARQNWEPGRINVVTVLTDGQNDDKDGISLDQLLGELKKLQDPRRPLYLTGIGIGDGVDPAELKAIADATGGAAFTTPDPTKINEIFYASLAKMLCQPPTCKSPPTGGG